MNSIKRKPIITFLPFISCIKPYHNCLSTPHIHIQGGVTIVATQRGLTGDASPGNLSSADAPGLPSCLWRLARRRCAAGCCYRCGTGLANAKTNNNSHAITYRKHFFLYYFLSHFFITLYTSERANRRLSLYKCTFLYNKKGEKPHVFPLTFTYNLAQYLTRKQTDLYNIHDSKPILILYLTNFLLTSNFNLCL